MQRQNWRVVDLFEQNTPFNITQPITPELIAQNRGQIKLWAWYEEPNTTVNFHHNFAKEGQTEKVHTEKINRNQPLRLPDYTLPSTDLRPGYNFMGWSLSESGGELLPKGYPLRRNETTDVYAQWAQGFTLEYYCGTKLVETQFFKTIPTEIPPVEYVPQIEKDDKTPKWVSSDEWYTTPALKEKVIFATVFTGAVAGTPVKVYGNLLPIIPVACQITLMSNGGTFDIGGDVTTATLDALTGDLLWHSQEYAQDLKDRIPTLEAGDNRELFGWFLDADCTVAADVRVPMVKDATYYAGWACPVIFNKVGTAARRSVDGTADEKRYALKGDSVECVVFPDKTDSKGSSMHLAGWEWKYTGTVDESKYPEGEFWDFQVDEVQNKLDLTAVWDYRVDYNAQGGQLSADQMLYIGPTEEPRFFHSGGIFRPR